MRKQHPLLRHPPVHPHVCGEHANILGGVLSNYGSSPRVWGTCYGFHEIEHSIFGSSPRVWGTYRFRKLDFAHNRFIPTCVGNMLNALL